MSEERGSAGAPAEAEDVRGDSPSEVEAAADVEADIDRLLEDTKRERDEYLELAQRTRADFENYRKRVAAEAASAADRGKARLAAPFIRGVHNRDRPPAAADVAPTGSDEVENPLEQGILLTYRELNEALGRAGVEV